MSIADNQWIDKLAHRARPEGPQLTGEVGRPRLLESALDRQHRRGAMDFKIRENRQEAVGRRTLVRDELNTFGA